MSDEAWVLLIACGVMFVLVIAVLLVGDLDYPEDRDEDV